MLAFEETANGKLVKTLNKKANNNVKILFVIGMNDGKFPMIHSDEGFINDFERDLLLENGIEIAKKTNMSEIYIEE